MGKASTALLVVTPLTTVAGKSARSLWLAGGMLLSSACTTQLDLSAGQAGSAGNNTQALPASSAADPALDRPGTGDASAAPLDTYADARAPQSETMGEALCPAGSYASYAEGEAVVCRPCEAGSFSPAPGASACIVHRVCPPGTFVAREGAASSDVVCAACTPGTFSVTEDALECAKWRDCMLGEYVAASGTSTTDRQCTACGEGESSVILNAGACTSSDVCPAGTVALPSARSNSAEGVLRCMPCAAGTYCAGASASVAECEDGTWDEDANPATPCIDKTSCVVGQDVEDEGSATADRVCRDCDAGSYSDRDHASVCAVWTDCEPGQHVERAGTVSADRICAPCGEGTFSDELNAPICRAWTTCAAPIEYQTDVPSPSRDRSCAPCTAPLQALQDNASECLATAYVMSDGLVSIEAEHFHASTAGATDAWQASDVAGISGARCVEVGPEDGDHWTSDVENTAPRLDYVVQLPEAGSYYFYVRADPGMTGRSSDSCFVAINGVLNPAELTFGTVRGAWRWAEQTLQVPSAGTHTVSIYAREDGLRVDKLVLSSAARTMMGNGPAESRRTAP